MDQGLSLHFQTVRQMSRTTDSLFSIEARQTGALPVDMVTGGVVLTDAGVHTVAAKTVHTLLGAVISCIA